MAVKSVPVDFNWVTSRAECSLLAVFKALELGAREDVETVTSLVMPHERVSFSVVASHCRFSVIREDGATPASPIPRSRDVNFTVEGQEIVASKGNKILLRAAITLNNEGQCKLKIGDEELEQWQVRRMALEELFFGPFSKPSQARRGNTLGEI
jgi:hypothetical protein